MIQFTDRAIEKIRQIKQQEGAEKEGLRIGVKGGGCSGLTYVMFFDNSKAEDQVLEFDDVQIFVDSKSFVYLVGATIDFTDGLNGSGFVFQNPNATRSCGCGNSFAV